MPTTTAGYRREPRTSPVATVICADCGGAFELADRNVRRHRQDGTAPRCAVCRGMGQLPTPRPEDREFWLDAVGIEEARKLAGMIWPEG